MDVAIGLPNAVPPSCSGRCGRTRWRWPSYEIAGVETETRGKDLDAMLEEDARAYLTDYYAWLGEDIANFIAAGAAKDADTVKQYLAAFEEAGCQELFLFPSSSDPQQVDLLADAAGL